MNIATLKKLLKDSLRQSPFVLVGMLIAVAFFAIHIQLYIPMARLQHYGLAIFIVGLSYILQAIWSWTKVGLWSRAGQLFSGLYLGSAAMVFYANPWLDPKMSLRTEAQEDLRDLIILAFVLATVLLVVFCILWIIEERQNKPVRCRKNSS